MSLEGEIESRAREIHADGYAMSIGEVINMYRDGDLEIHPEFQRIFRWTLVQQSRLIESIFLGIPIPAIFVAQRDDGIWDVVDGVQRLSTILRFVGVLRGTDGRGEPAEPLVATEYLPSLQDATWEGEDGEPIPAALRRDFKRGRLEFSIIKRESDPNAKFDLFQRLNSGTHLSEQEARNCLLVMLDRHLYQWLVELASAPDFLHTVLLTERKEQEQYHVELALRFLVGMHRSPVQLRKEMTDVTTYLDKFIMWMAESDRFARGDASTVFSDTFRIIKRTLGEDAFRRYDAETDRHLGGFSISAFEVVAWGIALHRDHWHAAIGDRELQDDLYKRATGIWVHPEFQRRTGSGIRGSTRIPNTLELATHIFSP